MSVAKKCDRCHTYFEDIMQGDTNDINYALVGLKNKNGDWRQNEHYDLCPKCGSQLKEWLTYPEYTSVTICRHTPMGTTNKIDPEDAVGIIKEHNEKQTNVIDEYNGKEIDHINYDHKRNINTYFYKDGSSRQVEIQMSIDPIKGRSFREVSLDERS